MPDSPNAPNPAPPPAPHLPRLSHALREVVDAQVVASLGTLDGTGHPHVSMVPYARWPGEAALVVHVSALAPHTANLRRDPRVGVMVMATPDPSQPVQALPRVSFEAIALCDLLPDQRATAQRVYLARFPEAEPMTAFADFAFVRLDLRAARQVAGFGAARGLDSAALAEVFSAPASPLLDKT